MMTDKLPDCMMPDGAEPCQGFTALRARVEGLEKERDKWRRLAGQAHHDEHDARRELVLARARVEQMYTLLAQINLALTGSDDRGGEPSVLDVIDAMKQQSVEQGRELAEARTRIADLEQRLNAKHGGMG